MGNVIIYLVSAIIIIAVTTFVIKFDVYLAEKNPVWFTLAYILSLIPYLNVPICIIMIIGMIGFLMYLLVVHIIKYFVGLEEKDIKKQLDESKKYDILIRGLIDAKYFNDNNSVDEFIDGVLVADALIGKKKMKRLI